MKYRFVNVKWPLWAAKLVRRVPEILAITTVSQLTAAKTALESEVSHRRRAEEALLLERAQLEHRVFERTEQLARATAAAEQAHAEAEEANKLKDRFLAKVSHELRTPLQSTLSWAQVLRLSANDPVRTMEAADRIVRNVRSQARLLDDLLDISRILSGKLSLEMAQVDAGAIVRKAAEGVRSATTSKGTTIDIEGPEGPLPMTTDALRLEQVVWNLISNAVQASLPDGRVAVRFGNEAQRLRIDVQDWGCGIDPAEIESLFEPFHQSSHGDRSHRGLGLGLAITRRIVERFSGRIEAHSAGLGHGAVFTLHLPLGSSEGTEVHGLAASAYWPAPKPLGAP